MLVVPLDSPDSDLSTVGGKGHNLSVLSRGAINVPPGFIVTIDAYFKFIRDNKHLATLVNQLTSKNEDDLEEASALIRAAIQKCSLSNETQAEVSESLSKFEASINFAVRSSGSCEDMPDASFAGQHDTYLNVPTEQVCQKVVECFASLFTPRAIAYRNRNGISHDLGMAVVVQCMAPDQESSGVLFTANPLTGRRNESVLEAIPGLGEALVSGLTEPDRYVVLRKNGQSYIRDKRVGAKAKAILSVSGGGVKESVSAVAASEVLSDHDVNAIVQLGDKVQQLYSGKPQDIEWCKSTTGELSIVQSRPITTLFPRPNVPMNPLQIYFSFNAVQGISQPIYPAGQDAVRKGLLGGLLNWITWGRHGHTGGFILTCGERMFLNITNPLRNVLGRKFLLKALPNIDAGSFDAIEQMIEDEQDLTMNTGVGPIFVLRLLSLAAIIVPRLILSFLFPEFSREMLYRQVDMFVQSVEEKVNGTDGLSEIVALQKDALQSFFPLVFQHLLPRLAVGMGSLGALGHLSSSILDGKDLTLTVTRGLPHNVTSEMDLELWLVAKTIQDDARSLHHFKSTDADVLANEYNSGILPGAAQTAVGQFMSKYGMRGLYEIDFGRPRWREDPTPLMNTLKSYVEIKDEHAPDKVFAKGEVAAEQAIFELGKRLNKPWLVSILASRVRQLGGIRELPKFTAIRVMGLIRAKMVEEGNKLVAKGILDDARDLFYLYSDEMDSLAKCELVNCKTIIEGRKAAMDKESKRTHLPRVIASDGYCFFGGSTRATIVDTASMLAGEPVSPGVYEGRIRVVHDPTKTKLNQGEVLCCHGTDPSWTPLFLSAGALVMDVGGIMTHGSVVAREYGIPAVVGLEKVTERLKTGQLVRVDGSSGTVQILE